MLHIYFPFPKLRATPLSLSHTINHRWAAELYFHVLQYIQGHVLCMYNSLLFVILLRKQLSQLIQYWAIILRSHVSSQMLCRQTKRERCSQVHNAQTVAPLLYLTQDSLCTWSKLVTLWGQHHFGHFDKHQHLRASSHMMLTCCCEN